MKVLGLILIGVFYSFFSDVRVFSDGKWNIPESILVGVTTISWLLLYDKFLKKGE